MTFEPSTVLLLGSAGEPLTALERLLRSAGCSVRTASTPLRANDAWRDAGQGLDALIVDEEGEWWLGAAGPEAAAARAARSPSVVVLSSSLDEPVERVSPSAVRLRKPVAPEALLRELQAGRPAPTDADAEAPRMDLRHGGAVLLVGRGLANDGDWNEGLELAGFDVATAGDAVDACRICEWLRFDLVLTDAQADGASPAEALLAFRSSFRLSHAIAVLVPTTIDEYPDRVRLEELGIDLICSRQDGLQDNLTAIDKLLNRLDRAPAN